MAMAQQLLPTRAIGWLALVAPSRSETLLKRLNSLPPANTSPPPP